MTSKITIETDFDNGKTFFRILEDTISDDMRDKALHAFRIKLQHTSLWCQIVFPESKCGPTDPLHWRIYPLTPYQLREQASIMMEQADLLEKNHATPSNSH